MSAQQPRRQCAAEQAWAEMKTFVEGNNHPGDLRGQLGLGRGTGRIKVLLLLAGGPLSLGEIADAANTDAPHATIIVDKLESLELAERTLDPRDRRRKSVALTESGRAAVRIAQAKLAAAPPAFGRLSDVQLDQLLELLALLGAS